MNNNKTLTKQTKVKHEALSIIDRIVFDIGNSTKDKEVTKAAIALSQIGKDDINLNPLIDTIGKDNFYKLLKYYGGKTLTFPDYTTIMQNELLLASKDLMSCNKKEYKWEDVKRILNISKLKGYFHLSEFFSSISFSRRISSYEKNEDTIIVKKFNNIVDKIKTLKMSEKEWKEHFEDPISSNFN